jgi:transaldolase/glucose-6-phosphate isomerase
VQATPAGIPAIEALIGEGININVTLIFGLDTYEAVAAAYLAGLERRAVGGGDVGQVASVASFFVSRVDSAVDKALAAMNDDTLLGKIAIANAKAAFARATEIFAGDRWRKLAGHGARVQRLLWASTGTKNPAYPDTLYLDELIGPDTVNTVPPATLNAFLDHGTVASTLGQGLDQAQSQLKRLAGLGIDLNAITQTLQKEGVASFADAFAALIAGVAHKRGLLRASWKGMSFNLMGHQSRVDKALAEIRDQQIVKRIWQHDHTVWRSDPTEITNRLGWLHSPAKMPANVDRIMGLVRAVRSDGYTQVLLLGMGGSSLAPEMFAQVFAESAEGLQLAILDSTDPDMLLDRAQDLDLSKTLFIVATKSGGTAETLSAFKYFYNRLLEVMDADTAGQHFIAITDPGSALVDLAGQYSFRDTFLNDPDIGGRYSALSFFGLVPAAMVGVDLETLLARAQTAAGNAESCNCPVDGDNAGARLGAIMGELAQAGRDKMTIISSPVIASFGDWVEQLVAESTGKDGTGILPVVGEPPGAPEVYGNDRLFVHIRLDGDDTHDAALAALEKAGHPVVTMHMKDAYEISGQFFLWEMATAIAGARLGIQPFDQPNVEAAKVLAREVVAAYMETGMLPAGAKAPLSDDALKTFLNQARPGDYVSIQAYVQPTPATDGALHDLRLRLRDTLKLATTVGYGPRFLHSTGQLHKGDAGNGLFIQFTSQAVQDVPIPDEAGRPASAMSFGVLKNAQALGDAQALRDAGRRVICFDLGTNVLGGLNRMAGAL